MLSYPLVKLRNYVSNPMDMGTIRRQVLQSQIYADDASAFARDMRLVFSNCMTFNLPGSALHGYARDLAVDFDRLYDLWVVQTASRPADPDIPLSEAAAAGVTIVSRM